jgi:hypothetical protein
MESGVEEVKARRRAGVKARGRVRLKGNAQRHYEAAGEAESE